MRRPCQLDTGTRAASDGTSRYVGNNDTCDSMATSYTSHTPHWTRRCRRTAQIRDCLYLVSPKAQACRLPWCPHAGLDGVSVRACLSKRTTLEVSARRAQGQRSRRRATRAQNEKEKNWRFEFPSSLSPKGLCLEGTFRRGEFF